MQPIPIQTLFAADYAFKLIERPVVHFPFEGEKHVPDILVEVTYNDTGWCGVFTPGPGKSYGLYTCPNRSELCVLAGGTAFIVNVERAANYTAIIFENIVGVMQVPQRNVLLLNTDTDLIAYEQRVIWQERLCLDELSVERADDSFAHVSCWDPFSSERVQFRVNLESGDHPDYTMP